MQIFMNAALDALPNKNHLSLAAVFSTPCISQKWQTRLLIIFGTWPSDATVSHSWCIRFLLPKLRARAASLTTFFYNAVEGSNQLFAFKLHARTFWEIEL